MEKTRNYLIISLITFSLIFIYFGNKKEYLSADNVLGVYVNDELSENIPSKDMALFQKAICDDENAKVTWDSDNWGLLISNLNQKIKCNLYFYSGQTIFDFDYTGGEQTFTATLSGTYKLETWGAQGGNSIANGSNYETGGKGGYSSGYIKLNTNDALYINIGGKGDDGVLLQNDISGGYNGGGISHWDKRDDEASGGGGGATHIASTSGILSNLENKKDSILIVSGSGGGGGSEWHGGSGGSGGGFKGNDGNVGTLMVNENYTMVSISPPAKGGSQNFGGTSTKVDRRSKTTSIYNGSFGTGGYTVGGDGGGQGGNGYYGGGASDYAGGGGGGSGYIGNHLLTNKVMYCYNCEESNEESTKTISTTCSEETPTSYCAKKGNGYARITLISIDK